MELIETYKGFGIYRDGNEIIWFDGFLYSEDCETVEFAKSEIDLDHEENAK